MIVEILVGATIVSLSSAVAGYLRARRRTKEREQGGTPAARPGAPAPAATTTEPAGPRGLRIDDVLLYASEELWLAGMLELDEEGLVGRLFCVPGARRASWLLQLDADGERLALLRDCTEVPTGSVPERLRIDGMLLSLTKRGRARVTAAGASLPRTEASARYALLSAPGGRTLLVLDFDTAPRIAVSGELVPREMLELLPGT